MNARLKKVFEVFLVACIVFFSGVILCYGDNADATFAWEQPDYAKVNYWVLYWGANPGGPYDVGSVQIDKTLLQESQTAPVVIPYPADAKTTYYFVLVAFIDADKFSANSNEVPLEVDFRIPPDQPLNLRVTIIPAS